jgi:hypothetical protein
LIQQCGYLLASCEDRQRANARILASNPVLGDNRPGYIGMTGSICHCGPACAQSRVLMFSSYKKCREETGYSGNTKYNAASFLGQIILCMEDAKTPAATLDAMLRLFENILEGDPSLGAFLETMDDSPSSTAFEELKGIKAKVSRKRNGKKA